MPNYDARENTYRGKKIILDNIEYFQQWFLECQYHFADNQLRCEELEDIKDTLSKKEYSKLVKELKEEKSVWKTEAQTLYKIIYFIRYTISNLYNSSELHKKAIDEKAKTDYIWWINMFVRTFDPRLNVYGIPPMIFLVLTPKQQDILRTVEHCYRENKNVLIEKSRAEGLTEILIAWDVHHWLYEYGYKSGWGSRIEDLVDKKDEPDALFPRIRRVIYGLPKKMRPTGFSDMYKHNPYDNRMRIVNPDNASIISGGAGDNIGRGGRSSNYKVDEYSKVANPKSVDEALSYNTNCQIVFGTPNGMNRFYEKKLSGLNTVITSGWWENPSKNINWQSGIRDENSSWYKLQKRKHDSVTIAQEIDIDYHASIGDVFIPSKWVRAAVDLKLPNTGERVSGFDIAADGKDIAAYISREGVTTTKVKQVFGKTPLDYTWQAAMYSDEDDVSKMFYDKNTIGENVAPVIENGEKKFKFEVVGIYGQSAASDEKVENDSLLAYEKFRNKRGELWWNLRQRFMKTYEHTNKIRYYSTSELISIPNHSKLISELSTPKMVFTTTGKIGVESKREMKARNVASPNYADALTYCYSDVFETNSLVPSLVKNNINYSSDFEVDLKGFYTYYVSLFQTENFKTYILLFQQSITNGKINIIREIEFQTINVQDIKYALKSYAKMELRIEHWVGNDKIFEGFSEGKKSTWYLFKKYGINLKQNYTHNDNSAFIITNENISKKFLRIHKSCIGLIDQLKTWTSKRSKPKAGYYYLDALLQIMTFFKRKKLIKAF